MVKIKEVESDLSQGVFWGVAMQGGKRYSQKVVTPFHISMAALEPGSAGEENVGNGIVTVWLGIKGFDYLMCTLKHDQIFNVALDYELDLGEELDLFINGKGTVYLTGYLRLENDPPNEWEDYDDDDDASEGSDAGVIEFPDSDEEEEEEDDEKEDDDDDDVIPIQVKRKAKKVKIPVKRAKKEETTTPTKAAVDTEVTSAKNAATASKRVEVVEVDAAATGTTTTTNGSSSAKKKKKKKSSNQSVSLIIQELPKTPEVVRTDSLIIQELPKTPKVVRTDSLIIQELPKTPKVVATTLAAAAAVAGPPGDMVKKLVNEGNKAAVVEEKEAPPSSLAVVVEATENDGIVDLSAKEGAAELTKMAELVRATEAVVKPAEATQPGEEESMETTTVNEDVIDAALKDIRQRVETSEINTLSTTDDVKSMEASSSSNDTTTAAAAVPLTADTVVADAVVSTVEDVKVTDEPPTGAVPAAAAAAALADSVDGSKNDSILASGDDSLTQSKKKKKKKKKKKSIDAAAAAAANDVSTLSADASINGQDDASTSVNGNVGDAAGKKKKSMDKSKTKTATPTKAAETTTTTTTSHSPKTQWNLPGGTRATEYEEGTGDVARKGAVCFVKYTGRLQKNQKVFDTNVDDKLPLKVVVGSKGVIDGFDAGLEGMKVGGKRRLVIPPHQAYGKDSPSKDIPPNSALIFDIELVRIGGKKARKSGGL